MCFEVNMKKCMFQFHKYKQINLSGQNSNEKRLVNASLVIQIPLTISTEKPNGKVYSKEQETNNDIRRA